MNKEEFIKQITAKTPTLVDFYADWCGPCQMQMPIVDEVATEHSVIKINIDQNPEIAKLYRVSTIPTLIVFKGEEEFQRFVGITPKDDLIETIDLASK